MRPSAKWQSWVEKGTWRFLGRAIGGTWAPRGERLDPRKGWEGPGSWVLSLSLKPFWSFVGHWFPVCVWVRPWGCRGGCSEGCARPACPLGSSGLFMFCRGRGTRSRLHGHGEQVTQALGTGRRFPEEKTGLGGTHSPVQNPTACPWGGVG